ncbi:hypothetical protein [Thiohalocapsa halophila]|uniref:hypothetical protein n=1 Tax=Thiohalocapsa halophila TaxID=69359 RepID=UPI001904BB0D|nr:hypothetical protein [Thiohalocapsa halophila]
MAKIRQALYDLPDARRGGNNQRYMMGDGGLSAFSVIFMQSPSFLDFQVCLQKERGRNNASALFGVHEIPCTQQICNLLDPVAPEQLAPVFMDLVGELVAGGALGTHRTLDSRLLVASDGTEHHCSEAIRCPQFSTQTLANDPMLPHGAHAGGPRPGAGNGAAPGAGVHRPQVIARSPRSAACRRSPSRPILPRPRSARSSPPG